MITRNINTSRRACFSPAQEKEIWAWNLEVSHYLRYLFPTTAMVVAMMSNANAGCDTYITLTANGAPAFTTVSSVIYDDNGSFVMAENRHSYTASLPCGGTYTLVSGDRSRKFQAGSTFSMNVGGIVDDNNHLISRIAIDVTHGAIDNIYRNRDEALALASALESLVQRDGGAA